MKVLPILLLAALTAGCCSIFDRPGFSIYSGFEDFEVGFRLAANGDATCFIQNLVGSEVTVWDVNVFDGVDGGILCGQTVHETLPPGESFTVDFRNCGRWVNGTRYLVKIEIDYSRQEGSKTISLTEEGTVKSTVTELKIWGD